MSITAEIACTLCNKINLKTVIDFGLQPPSNRFIAEDNFQRHQEMHHLALGYCEHCHTAQLTARMPFEAIRPRYSWLTYNEPEGHLDQVAQELIKLPAINPNSRFLGITYKDQTTIDRLAKLGFHQGKCLNEEDFGFSSNVCGLETVQQVLREPPIINRIKEKYGLADLILMRHVIEHTDNIVELLLNLKNLITKNGLIVLELPDSEQIFRNGNHAFIWEEHISYFTEHSLTALVAAAGAELKWLKRCSYPYEDSLLVAFSFPAISNYSPSITQSLVKEWLTKFRENFKITKHYWQEKLISHQNNGEKIAIFGAGHLAVKFINFFQLKSFIECVIDDHPHKKGMFMPGSLLPIVSSEELITRKIRVCISTLSPESEMKVRQKLSSYLVAGGILLPAFITTTH